MGETKIQWCDFSFNPWVGCTKISPGCDRCYAESWAKRTGSAGLWQGQRRRTSESNWRLPLKWNAACAAAGTRARVFCASLADVFDNTVSNHWRWDLFQLINRTRNLDWLLLTKRIGNAREMLNSAAAAVCDDVPGTPSWDRAPWRNVWLGSTVVNQEEADRDISKLLATPARVRFLSMEPLLGPVDLSYAAFNGADSFGQMPGINWVIVGGESGGRARQIEVMWVTHLQRQCREAGVAFFVKQLGRFPIAASGDAVTMRDSHGGDMAEWPESLRMREFPA